MLVDNKKQEIDLQKGDSINIDSEAYLVAELDYTSPFLLEGHLIADSVGEIISNILRVDVNDKVARILTCPPHERCLILDRIVGGAGKDRLNKSKGLFDSTVDENLDFSKPPEWGPPPDKTKEAEEDQTEQGHPPPQTPVGAVSVIVIDKGPITPSPKRVVVRRLQLNPKTGTPSSSKKKADPDRSEDLAVEFEKAENRHPIKISHIRGLKSYGCDIISFKSEGDLNSFKTNNKPDFIERFIEVKGSSSEKGSVTLKGNQLRSAQIYKEKFFIYRIYEDKNTGSCELVEVNNPLDCEKDALEPQYEVDLFRSIKSHLWEIKEQAD